MSGKKRVFKTAGRIVLLAIISLVIGSRLYDWNARTLTGNEMPMPFGFGVSVVLSGSMEPELAVNDLVIVKAADDYKVGDVVVYQDGGSLVIHKLISLEGGEAVTKGVANDTADEPIKVSAIKGRAVAHIPYLGAVARFLKAPAGFILVLVAAAVLFEVPYMQERRRADEEREKIKEEIRRLKGE